MKTTRTPNQTEVLKVEQLYKFPRVTMRIGGRRFCFLYVRYQGKWMRGNGMRGHDSLTEEWRPEVIAALDAWLEAGKEAA